jgi:cytochrome c-type biogenesis protein
MARLILVIALASLAVMGLVTGVGCDGVDTNGDIPNGNAPNGELPNGDEPNGDKPNGEPAEPDLISGLGLIIDCDQNTGDDPEAGDPSFDFRFEDAVGNTYALSDFRGRVVVLNFWSTACSNCQEELPYIQRLYDEWATELVLLTIAKGQEPATVADFVQAEGLTFPVIVDRLKLVSSQYRVTGIPRTFFIDGEGYIMGIKRGYFSSYEEIEDILDQIFADQGG